MKRKSILGLVEKVTFHTKEGNKTILAKIDTGATRSSIDASLAKELGLGPAIYSKMIKSAHGSRLRPIIMAEVELDDKKIKEDFTIIDRSHMKYQVLIGVNILKYDFLIDPQK